MAVFGRVEPVLSGSERPVSLYTVGSQKLQEFVAPEVPAPKDNVAFFNSNVMPYGEHTLIINISRASGDAPYFLDYIRFNTSDPDSGAAGLTTSEIGIPQTTNSNKGSSALGISSPARSLVGPIVGGVVGGVVIITAVLFAFFCFRHRRRRSGAHAVLTADSEGKYCTSGLNVRYHGLIHYQPCSYTGSSQNLKGYVPPSVTVSQGRPTIVPSPQNILGATVPVIVGQHDSTRSHKDHHGSSASHAESAGTSKATLSDAHHRSDLSSVATQMHDVESARAPSRSDAESISGSASPPDSPSQLYSVDAQSSHSLSSHLASHAPPVDDHAHSIPGVHALSTKIVPSSSSLSRPCSPPSMEETSEMPFQPILSSDTFASHLPPPVGPGPEIVDSNEAELEIIPPVIGIGECQLLMQSF